ncbi:hypothetical protein [Candidatus Thiodictyon syntrophicum]|jgi:hypothetical protein|uniref:hypothetical protein n=1 Tax=Candidatus Thiodictyon syntrophicum TaxID=1166950 RepID=UPI000C2D0CA0|nr:hypothetical protein [Candidatus Thiodictyon syntrophicum]
MKLDEALSEKYRIQAMLSGSAKDIHDYFERSHTAAKKAMAEIGASPNYSKPQQVHPADREPPSGFGNAKLTAAARGG